MKKSTKSIDTLLVVVSLSIFLQINTLFLLFVSILIGNY